MAADSRVIAMTADIGFRNFDRIIADFPERFFNVGVAEANMIGVAAGLALNGKVPFVFTIAPFVTMRCLEQIRVDLCYLNLPVKIIGAGGGFVYGRQGTTHHAIEEIGQLRTLPHMTIISPSDPVETYQAVLQSMDLDGPAYIRIGRNKEPVLHTNGETFRIGQAETMTEGNDVTIFAHGLVVINALKAHELLQKQGIQARIVNMHTIKPLDRKSVQRCALETGAILTVEEHNVIGGLGSAVAEVLAENVSDKVLFRRLGVADRYLRNVAEHETLQKECGLDPAGIAAATLDLLGKEIGRPGLTLVAARGRTRSEEASCAISI